MNQIAVDARVSALCKAGIRAFTPEMVEVVLVAPDRAFQGFVALAKEVADLRRQEDQRQAPSTLDKELQDLLPEFPALGCGSNLHRLRVYINQLRGQT